MADDFRVTVNSCGPDRPLFLRWTDPNTGRRLKRSSGTHDRREAERLAGILEKELREGKYAPPSQLLWEDFTWRYCDQVLPGLAKKTGRIVNTVFNQVDRVLGPRRLAQLTSPRLAHFASQLRAEGRSEATIRSYLAHLKSALRWAHDVGLLQHIPKFPKVQRAKRQKVMRGRPLTTEEFERILDKVEEIVGVKAAPSWVFFLQGLWTSGLRLEEAVNLSWDGRAGLCVDLTEKRPVFWIPAEGEKGNQNRILPMAPEFALLLESVPEDLRRGRVFKLRGIDASRRQGGGRRGASRIRGPEWVGRIVARIGQAAGVKVDERLKRNSSTGERSRVVKYATAHDFRRSFGERWARRIMPVDLKDLMRHESIETTMRYYVGRNAAATADVLWTVWEAGNPGAFGPTFGPVGATGFEPATF